MYPNYNNPYYMPEPRDRMERQQLSPAQTTPGNITQNFQLTSTPTYGSAFKYANTIDDVKHELVFGDTLFMNRDFTTMWLKNPSGDIRTFDVKEVVILDERDIEIQTLKNELAELKKVIQDATEGIKSTNEQPTTKKSTFGKSSKTNDE